MSRALLEYLNGDNNGLFRSVLDTLGPDPNIVWYPSAGTDFRPLLLLSPQYADVLGLQSQEIPFPDIFLFSDYYPWESSSFLDTPLIYKDKHTEVVFTDVEMLSPRYLPLDPEILLFLDRKPKAYGQVIFLKVQIKSDLLGTLEYPVLYVFNENEAFCSKVLLPQKARISHIYYQRYGNGFGGGLASGYWLLNVMKRLQTSNFIYQWMHGQMDIGDKAALMLYPNLRGVPCNLKEIRNTRKPRFIWCKVE
jgi:hypothetical protein